MRNAHLFLRWGAVETVMVMSQQKPDDVVRVGIDIDKMNVTKAESKATYAEIQTRVKEQTGLKPTPCITSPIYRASMDVRNTW